MIWIRPVLLARGYRTCLLLAFSIILAAILPTRAQTQSGFFTEAPVWSSGQANWTSSVALGDVDGDGDLDLVCGNHNQYTTLYENIGGTFTSMPVWSSGQLNSTSAVALGDVDGDGDLDLVCGNINNQSITLYENVGGAFTSMPVWSSSQLNCTDLALGDVDGDGDLDLVCAGYDPGLSLYENVDGIFAPTPAWVSTYPTNAVGVVLGDVDGDGDLDLVCAEYGPGASLYKNIGGTFTAAPVWKNDISSDLESVALGDVDGDGDLDLVCGNVDQNTTLYENTDTTFASMPAWSSQVNATSAVALGDIDGDGDLDLVCGNLSNQSTTLYENTRGPFAPIPAWFSVQSGYTRSMALGDIDGDGVLDLVCGDWSGGTTGGKATLYKGVDGTFTSVPTWSSYYPIRTSGVALADVDRDGDLDLVSGNAGESSTLYENTGGTFGFFPAWSSGQANSTTSVALGDVDGDGYPDLVCGNSAQSTTLYSNTGGTFDSLPAWSSGRANRTESVALGDVDGDGDLDLVCGNWEEGTTLYENVGGTFTTMPVWVSGQSSWTYSVTLGDVDGDGDLDLVCGNQGQSTTLYENIGGVFTSLPVWSSGLTSNTQSVALEDVDGDGDLDLVCGNYGQSVTLYENIGGVLTSMPVWSLSENWDWIFSIALGDVDGDGDADLVCGYDSDSPKLYTNLRNPAYRGNPLAPTRHLPNNGPFMQGCRLVASGENRLRAIFRICDVDSDLVSVAGDYQFVGEPGWHRAILEGGSVRTDLISTTPGGVTDSLEWDTRSVPFDRREVVLRLRVVEIPRTVSIIQHASSYSKLVGPVVPIRPELTSSADSILFSQTTITVGDTTSRELVLSNTGTRDLQVISITLPSQEMRIEEAAPYTLHPGQVDTVTIFLEPRYEIDISGYVEIKSNDPLTPTYSIMVETDIRGLNVSSELLKSSDVVPLGEAITVVVTPAPLVNVERGYLHYRKTGAASFGDSIPLSEFKNEFVAVIPGEAVTEGGIEYFIRVENSGAFGTDPPGAPGAFYTQAVGSPIGIIAEPIPTSGQDYLADRGIRVQIVLPAGSSFVSGALHYRKSGMADYAIDSLAIGEAFPVASVPDSMVTARGVEYWVDVNTLTAHLSDPPVDPSHHPRTLPITVQNLIEPYVHRGGEKADAYRVMSIPLEFKEDFAGTIEALLSDQAAFGPYDPAKWRSFVYLPESGTYGELNSQSLAERFRPTPGRAFWLISRANHQISTAPISGRSTPTDKPFALELASGWNMVGSPFVFPVSWDSVRVDTLTMREAVGVSVDPPIRWDGAYHQDVPAMEPFEGYWIYNRTDHAITLHVPPKESMPGARAAPLPEVAQEPGLRLMLRAASGDQQDAVASIGTAPEAARALDRFDRMKPPSAPGQGISLYFVAQGEGERYHRLSADMRPEPTGSGDWGEVWACDIEKSFSLEAAGDAVTISVDSVIGVPAGVKVALVDRTLDREIDLAEHKEYTFYLGTRSPVATEQETRFRLIVGTESFVTGEALRLLDLPTLAALYQNYPNPFNPSTVIRYDVGEPGLVSLRIYSVTGALIRVLEAGQRDRGRYEVGWNGENDRGERVASGIYFYRLTAPGFSQTRKLVLVR